jgi:hypothetical protein
MIIFFSDDSVNLIGDIYGDVVPGLGELEVEEEAVSCLYSQKAARQQLRRGDVVSRVNTDFGRFKGEERQTK